MKGNIFSSNFSYNTCHNNSVHNYSK